MTRIDRYIGMAAFRSIVLVALGLTALFSLLEFVEQLSSVGQGHYRVVDALFYVVLTAPSRLLHVAPVSMLLGCLLSLGALAGDSELSALCALGVSEQRIAGSVLKLAVPIIVVLFLIAEFVIPPAQQFAETGRTARLSSSASFRNGDSFWAQSDGQYLNVQRFSYGNVPRNIDIYTFAIDGSLTTYIHADRADIRPDGMWLLIDVVRKRVNKSQFMTDNLASLSWHPFLAPKQTQLLILPPESVAPIALYQYVRDLQRRHQQAIRYEQELWAKISIPLSIVAMIMISIPFVFGPPRSQSMGQQVVVGAVCGIVFTLCQQIAGQLDLLLNLSPALTALAPSLLLMALAVYIFQRTRRWRVVPVNPPLSG